MPWKDVRSDAPGGAWSGVEYTPALRATEPPYLHMEAAPPFFMRLMAGGSPLVWARIAPDHCGYWYLRSGTSARERRAFLAPITAAAARRIRGEPGSDAWYAAWSRAFLRELESSERTPLHSGHWWMVPCPTELDDDAGWRHVGGPWPGVPPAPHLDLLSAQPRHDFSLWDFDDDLPTLALRALSPEADGRVKFWRKALREGYLPPVLVLWISGLCRFVVLDGHDRLQAALLERRAAPVLALLPLTESVREIDVRKRDAIIEAVAGQLEAARAPPPASRHRTFSVELGNRLLVEAHDERPRLSLTSRAWPLRGGVPAWLDEVRTELGRNPAAEVESEMLAPYER